MLALSRHAHEKLLAICSAAPRELELYRQFSTVFHPCARCLVEGPRRRHARCALDAGPRGRRPRCLVEGPKRRCARSVVAVPRRRRAGSVVAVPRRRCAGAVVAVPRRRCARCLVECPRRPCMEGTAACPRSPQHTEDQQSQHLKLLTMLSFWASETCAYGFQIDAQFCISSCTVADP